MFRMSNYNNVIDSLEGKKWYNSVTRKGVNYSKTLNRNIHLITKVDFDSLAETEAGKLAQIIAKELLECGILVPNEIHNEYDYLKNLSPLIPPLKGFFNTKILDIESLRLLSDPIISFIGMPCDHGASRPGSRYGPKLLRDKSLAVNNRHNTNQSLISLDDKEHFTEKLKVYDLGDINFDGALNYDQCISTVKNVYKTLPNNVIPFSIGGDHGLSYPIIDCIAANHSELCVIQLDHHLDVQLYGEFDNKGPVELDKVSHGNFISHIRNKHPDIKILQIGVNNYIQNKSNVNEGAIRKYLDKIGSRITNRELMFDIKGILASLPKNKNVYLTIDVDVVDSIHIDKTGYPASLGISLETLFCIVGHLCTHNNILGVDIMEFGQSEHFEAHNKSSTIINYLIIDILNCLAARNP